MAARRINPYAVKVHRSYDTGELAGCLGVHKNTVRHWQREGLKPNDTRRPLLFQGERVRAFLTARIAKRKRPCPPGTLYCFRCRQPRPPALGMVDYLAVTAASGNLRAMCTICETIMHRRVRRTALSAIMPGLDVQFGEAPPRLKGRPPPSLVCDLKGRLPT